jgi:hypothetical protein
VKATGLVLTGLLLLGIRGAIPAAQGEAGARKKNLKRNLCPASRGPVRSCTRTTVRLAIGVEGKGDEPVAKFLKGPA